MYHRRGNRRSVRLGSELGLARLGSAPGPALGFYMQRRYGGRSLVIRLRKKEGVVTVVEGVTLVGPQ